MATRPYQKVEALELVTGVKRGDWLEEYKEEERRALDPKPLPLWKNILLTSALLAWLGLFAWSHMWAADRCKRGIATPPLCFKIIK